MPTKRFAPKPKSFCGKIKNAIVERKFFFSVLFLIFSVFVFVMGTQVFSPYSTFSKTLIKNSRVQVKVAENVRVATLFPSEDGFYGNWDANVRTDDHFTLVDEQKCSGEDYISSDIYKNMESFRVNISKIPDGSAIKQIDIIPCAAHVKQSGSPSAIQTFYRLDGIDSFMISHILADSVYPTETTIASWKNLNLIKIPESTLEIGLRNAGGDRGVKVGGIKMQVKYVPPAGK
jgi:hypothetical protein